MSTAARTGKNNLVFLLIGTVAASCAQVVKVHTPAPLFMSAEANGKLLKGGVHLTQQSGTEGTLVLKSEEIDSPMELRNNVSPLTTMLDLGILKQLDLYFRGGAGEGPAVIGLKYQVLGQPKTEAKKGNQSLAIALATGGVHRTTEEDREELFTNNDYDFKSEVSQSLTEASLIYSYRTEDDVVVYSGLKHSSHSFDVEVKSSSDPEVDGLGGDFSTDVLGASLGAIRYFTSLELSLELSAQKTDWTNNKETTFVFLSGALGWRW